MLFHFVALIHPNARYLTHVCEDGSSAWTHTIDCAEQLLNSNKVQKCTFVFIDTDSQLYPITSTAIQILSIPNTINALVQCMNDIAQNDTHVCLMFADSILSYIPLYVKMMDTHRQYLAHYTRSEGYPLSVAPEIFSPIACSILVHTLEEIKQSAHTREDTQIQKESLFKLVEKRINDYDIEAVLAPSDMRMLRISLSSDTLAHFTVSKKVWDSGLRNPDDILCLYNEKPQLFRSTPRYVYVQLTDAVQSVIYDAYYSSKIYNEQHNSMPELVWNTLLSKVSSYAEDAILSLGFDGEVAVHPTIFSMIRKGASVFSTVYIETNGYEWDIESSFWENIPQNVFWIIYLDAYTPEVYKTIRMDCIRGTSSHESQIKAHNFVELLLKKIPKQKVLVQATRMKENEADLDAFCKYWDAKGATPIIEKYNDVCGTLQDRKVIDLAPLNRFACRHLERDLVIDYEGNVLMCFQDIHKKHIRGNILKEDLNFLWKQNEETFVNHTKKVYHDICRRCDEYYTCNA